MTSQLSGEHDRLIMDSLPTIYNNAGFFRFGIRILTYWKWAAINSIAPLQLTDYVWATLTRVTRTLHSRAPDFKSSSDLRSLAM